MMRFLLFLLLGVAAPVVTAQAPKLELPKLEVSVNRVDADAQHMYEVDATRRWRRRCRRYGAC